MVHRDRDVLARYAQYCQLADAIKVSDHEFIYLKAGSSSHKRYKFGRALIEFEPEGETGKLTIRQPVAIPSDYGFQIFADEFTNPILRFDAEGPVHTNQADPSKGLLKRVIRLPHFHRYNERGEMESYRTEEIESNEAELLHDINKGLDCFCLENQVRTSAGGRIIVIEQMEMFVEDESSDLHKGIDFP